MSDDGRPDYPAIPDLQPRLDEKREALEAKLREMEAATPPPAAQAEPKTAAQKANAQNARRRGTAKK